MTQNHSGFDLHKFSGFEIHATQLQCRKAVVAGIWYNGWHKERKYMSKRMIDKIDYAVFCVNEFARSNSLSYRDAFDYLDKYQAIDYITDFYVENSQQPMSLMLQDMAECCRSRGGTLV